MATLTDVKKTMNNLISYIPSNINYLKNLLTSVNNISSSKLHELNFELEINIIAVDGFVDLTRQVHNITSVELHIFFSEPNSQMVKYINDGLGFSNILEYMVSITDMLIEVYERMALMEDGSQLDDNVADEMLSPYTDYINMYIKDSEVILELLQRYNNMINER